MHAAVFAAPLGLIPSVFSTALAYNRGCTRDTPSGWRPAWVRRIACWKTFGSRMGWMKRTF